jgi:putative DNA primase/helicase
MFGSYGKTASDNLLIASQHDRHAAELADLMGARLVVASEVTEGRHWDEAKLKRLTGGDTVSARWMRGNPFNFTPTHKFWIAGNHKPRTRDNTESFWRRIHLIPFGVTIAPEEQDKDLKSKLIAELPGILKWAVDGFLDYQHKGLDPPLVIVDATRSYRNDEDSIASFIEECCEKDPAAHVLVGALHEEYQRWSGDRDMSRKAFGTAMEERGYPRKRLGIGRCIAGLKLNVKGDVT